MKVSFVDRKLRAEFAKLIAWISTVISLILIFFDISDDKKEVGAIIFSIVIVAIYIILYFRANNMKIRTLTINGVKLTIKEGDIFSESGLKVIPFNEYFDTKVDELIISSKTLNGKYLLNECDDISVLDEKIAENTRLNSDKMIEVNNNRISGKTFRYKLGSIYKNNDYLLLAFSKFDQQNRAYVYANNLMECLFNMWDELDIIYGGHDINLPLIGTGQTRKYGMNLSEQEILEFILFTFKNSGVRFNRNTKINILIYKNDVEKIDFYSLKV